MSICVIVGHGRSPEGRGWGSRIDQVDAVIRMWDWAPWQPAQDYGTRYDYGIIEIGVGLIEKAMKHKKADPAKGWIASYLHGRRDRLPENTEVIDQAPWIKLGKGLGGLGATGRLQLTRGTIAACWAIEKQAWSEVVLVGFDVIFAGRSEGVNKDFSPAYQKNPGTFSFNGWQPNMQKFGNHDFRCEKKLLAFLSERNGVKLGFAQEVWNG